MSIEETIEKAVKEAVEKSLTIQKAEDLAFARFDEREISVEKAAILLNCCEDTVRSMIKFGELKALPRPTERSPYRLIMSDVLKYRKNKQLVQ